MSESSFLQCQHYVRAPVREEWDGAYLLIDNPRQTLGMFICKACTTAIREFIVLPPISAMPRPASISESIIGVMSKEESCGQEDDS